MLTYLILEVLAAAIGASAVIVILVQIQRRTKFLRFFRHRLVLIPAILFVAAFFIGLLANKTYPPAFAMPAFMHSHAPGGVPASLPFSAIINFFAHESNLERVADIGADPNAVPPLSVPDHDGIIRLHLTAKEVIAEIAPDISFNYWTYEGQVPGPMLHVREGDTVEVSLTNDPSSLHHHNIDLHAVTGPGGGASVTDVNPGETKSFRWKALSPGLYVYHCAMPNVSTHNSHGQYGLILVEPKGGLPKVDKEFYVMQGELYTSGQLGKKGLVPFDSEALLDGNPNYVTFNGKIEETPRMHVKVGDTVRMYVGNGGVNLISSLHLIGEIFDTVYPEANIGGAIERNVQTTAVLPGGATIVEFHADVPGKYLLVDHALARMNKGAWAVIEVTGDPAPEIFSAITPAVHSHE